MRPRIASRTGTAAGVLALALSVATTARGEDALFAPPQAGTYELPVIDRVGEHRLLAPGGARVPLLGLAPGQLALVAFVYRACSDAAGCPAALAALKGIDDELARRHALAPRVRLVTVSFDPEHDTPERIGELAAQLAPQTDWRFLTAASAAEIAPVLADFGQDVTRLVDATGEPLGALRHVVKLYLVDSAGAVRNIYSTGLLSVPLLLTDLETLAMDKGTSESSAARR
jgi:cytochrome c peroxidase